MINTVAVADAFMHPAYYPAAFAKHPQFNLTYTAFWGGEDRGAMRAPIRRLEREGWTAAEPPQDLLDNLQDAEALMVHLCPVDARVFDRAPKLKYVFTNRGGLENVDVKGASERGIVVLNNPAHNANAVAELTIALMIDETRNLARTHMNLMNGKWIEEYDNYGSVFELRGRTIGIFGFGNIGRRVARKLTVFDCRVLVHDPFVSPDDPDIARYGCEFVDKETLLRESDIFTLHVRAEEIVLNREELGMLKRGAYFINTARPHMVDNDALYELIASHHLMGAAFDVFPNEPLPQGDRLLSLSNVTLTNHRGGVTENCFADSPDMLLVQAERLLRGEEPMFFANKDLLGR